MFCKNCGTELMEGASFCTNCGTPIAEKKEKTCAQCGNPISDENAFCPYCGTSTKQQSAPNTPPCTTEEPKSKLLAGLFGILLGVFGVHNFYLGYNGKAVAQLILGVFGWLFCLPFLISWIWGLIEGIMILTSANPTDAKGNPLKKDI